MELRHLRYFISVADHLSFTKAARALHVSQPALSRQIRDLEEEFSCRLFHRHDGRVFLSREGALLLEPARKIAEAVSALPAVVKSDGDPGIRRIRIGYFGTFLALHLAPVVQRFRRVHHLVQIDLRKVTPRHGLQMLREGGLDAVFSGSPGTTRLGNLTFHTVFSQAPLIVLPSDHRLAKKRRFSLSDFRAETWAVWDECEFPGFAKTFEEACRNAGFLPAVGAVVDDVVSVFNGVANGDFIGYVGHLAALHCPRGLVTLPFPDGVFIMPIGLIWDTRNALAADIQSLAGMLSDPVFMRSATAKTPIADAARPSASRGDPIPTGHRRPADLPTR